MTRNPNALEPQRGPRMVDGWYVGPTELPADPIARLVYYAGLAPSSHNTQPWRFVAAPSEVAVFAEPARWRQIADPDRRELHLSLGCAIEALRVAADYAGFGTEVDYFPLESEPMLVARIPIALGGPKRSGAASDLLKSIVTRHTSHRRFAPACPVSDQDRKHLYECFEIGDVSLHFLSERFGLDALAAMEERAVLALFARPGYRKELARWIGKGGAGNSGLRGKLEGLAVGLFPLGRSIAHEDAKRVASAPLVALLSTRRDTRADQVQAGEAFMRIALVAEARGVRVQPFSQILEIPETRLELAALFGLRERFAQHLFRLGHAEAEQASPGRRPLKDILVSSG